ncbi:unnamed protein product [Closterium sp. Yama58-4]|nr:unnamed protein product [Closterium sp. Yama58-4]
MALIKERDRGFSSARFASPVSDIIHDSLNPRGISYSNRYSSGRDSRSISTGRNAIGAIDRHIRRCSRHSNEMDSSEVHPLDRPRSGPLEAALDLFESQARRPRPRPSTSGEFGGARDGAHEISAAVGAIGGNTATGDSLLHRRRLFRHNSAAFIRAPPRAVGFFASQSSNGSPCPSPSPTVSAAALAAPSPTSRSRLLQRLRGKSESPARADSAAVARNPGAIPLSRSVDESAPFPAEQESRSDITRVRSGRSGGRRMQATMSVANTVANSVASSASDAGASNVASIPRSGSSSGSFPRVARVPSSRNVANVAGVASVASIASLASLGGGSSEFSVSTIKSTFASDGSVAFSRSSSNSSLTMSASVANYSCNSAATGATSVAASLSTSATRADVMQAGVSLRDAGRQQAMRGSGGQRVNLGRSMPALLQPRSGEEGEAERGAESVAEGEEGEEGGAEVAAVWGAAEESEEWGDLEEFADVECANWQDISAICHARDAEGVKLLFVDIFVADVTAGLPDVAGSGNAQQQEPPSRSRSQIHAPSAECAREPAAADAADPSSHQHSSHKHSSHKSLEKEVLSELLSIADIPVASHKSSSSSHHHSRRHAAPATVVDPMHLKTASQHLKAARQQQIVESDASDSATGSSPPKQKIRNRVAASTNANATLDSFLTTSGNQADGENPTSVGDNGVTNVSGVEDMMFPSYSGHAKPDQVAEAVADVTGLKIQDATSSATSENDAPKADTSEKSEMRKSNSVSALENAVKKPHPRGAVNVETSEVLAAMRVWGANRGAANAAGNADSVFMQPYQGSNYSSYIDDHKTSPRVSSDAPAREEPVKLERSRSKSYPELAELAKSAAVPKIKPLGGVRTGEKSGGKAAVMDKLGVGQEDSEYADTEYFGWLLSGGSKFAKPASTRQGQEQPPSQ